jgi:hypothetical protein
MFITRSPQKEDISAIVSMAKDFQQNSLFKDCGFDEDKVRQIILKCIDPTKPYFMTVGEQDGIILGAFCGEISEYFFSKNRIATDLAIYVNPNDRRFTLKFLNKAIVEFETWAKKWGAMEICIAPSSGAYSPSFEKFLQKKKYDRIGFITKKGI